MKAKNWKYGFLLALLVVAILFLIANGSTGDSRSVRVEAVAISADGQTLAVSLTTWMNEPSPVPEISDVQQRIRLFEVATWDCREVDIGVEAGAMAFSPDGKHIVTGHRNGTIQVREVEDGRLIRTLAAHGDTVRSVDFSEDGAYLTSAGSQDGTAKIWKMPEGSRMGAIQHDDWVTSVSLSPDGRRLASGCRDSHVRIWDVQTSALITTLSGHKEGVTTVCFSHAGDQLVSGDWAGAVIVWHPETRTLIHRFAANSSGVGSLAISADDSLIAIGSGAGIRVRELSDGKVLSTMRGHAGRVVGVVFSGDGSTLISGAGARGMLDQSPDKTVRIWSVSTGEIKELIKLETERDAPPSDPSVFLWILALGGVTIWFVFWIRAIRAKRLRKPFNTILFAAVFVVILVGVGYCLLIGILVVTWS